MSVRRITEHHARTKDNEMLTIITIYEEGIQKQDIKKMNPYNKKYELLVKEGNSFRFIEKRA